MPLVAMMVEVVDASGNQRVIDVLIVFHALVWRRASGGGRGGRKKEKPLEAYPPEEPDNNPINLNMILKPKATLIAISAIL